MKNCSICQRFSATRPVVAEGPLPYERVTLSAAFSATGVDLAGPLYAKDNTKCWIVLFTCAAYRAVHLELVTSLTTDDFLLALRRFICQRGRPHTIYSDNGTNFEGTVNRFKGVDWDRVQQVYLTEPIKWKFNRPSAPWWGGFWERLVRVLKDLLKRMLGSKKLHVSQIENLLFDVEAIMNSRPLTYLSSDSGDLEPLTPAHFLSDLPDNSLPELEDISASDLHKRFTLQSQLRLELKTRFQKDYLSTLIHNKSGELSSPLQLNEIVLIDNGDKRRQLWNLDRITEFISERLVKVHTRNGEILRPIQRLYWLEIRDDSIPTPSLPKSVAQPSVWSLSVEQEQARRSCYGRLHKPRAFD